MLWKRLSFVFFLIISLLCVLCSQNIAFFTDTTANCHLYAYILRKNKLCEVSIVEYIRMIIGFVNGLYYLFMSFWRKCECEWITLELLFFLFTFSLGRSYCQLVKRRRFYVKHGWSVFLLNLLIDSCLFVCVIKKMQLNKHRGGSCQ